MQAGAPVVLFGWDGATFSILDPLMADGTMPFLRGFAAEGARGVLRSTPHPLSTPAWSTVMTGRSPGGHGVFDFVKADLEGDVPTYTLTTSTDVRADTIWSIVSRAGRRITALNFPCMFPPPEVNGFVVPGYVPWSYLSRAVHPPGLFARLREQLDLGRRELATDWGLERMALQGVSQDELERWVQYHIVREQEWWSVARFLMVEEPCQLTALVMDGVDRLHHLCYQFLDPHLSSGLQSPADRRVRDLCLAYFRQLDGYLEDVVSIAGPDATVVVMSDHGGQMAGSSVFHVNAWLEQQGYLAWADGVPLDRGGRLALDDHQEATALFDWSRTVAFALTSSSNGIYIRQSDEAGRVGVDPDDYPAFRERLAKELLASSDPATGEPLVDEALVRDEAFPGPWERDAPDLTVVPHQPGFVSILRADAPLKRRPGLCGTHHPDGVFIARGPAVRRGAIIEGASLLAVAPTLLYALGLPIPDDLEAAPLLEAFDPSFVSSSPPRYERAAGSLACRPSETTLSPEAETEVVERLKALGYLE